MGSSTTTTTTPKYQQEQNKPQRGNVNASQVREGQSLMSQLKQASSECTVP